MAPSSKRAPRAAVAGKAGYHHGDLKTQIVEAVRRLVEEKGPDGFSVAEASRLAGVSTAAPYKHFKDRPAILQAVKEAGLVRLEARMRALSEPFPAGSFRRVDAIGQAYIDFARDEPGVFRLIFALTESQAEDDALALRGKSCFAVIVQATADCLRRAADDAEVLRRAYMLWSFVHGHAFLVIDGKTAKMELAIDEPGYLADVSRGILGSGASN
eukprot:g13803.t1